MAPAGVDASLVQRLSQSLDRRRIFVLVGLSAWLFIALANEARAKAFWHDEVYTIVASRLPIGTLWRASQDGLDLSPPLNTIFTRVITKAVGVGPIATRMPAIAGFLTATILLFLTVRDRTNAVAGLAASLALCLTPAWRFAIEARGYGLTIGFFAAALYGWSEAAAGRRRRLNWVVMGSALAAGVWAHYYAVLAFLPIVVGESSRQFANRRLQAAPWLAIAVAGLATLPLWALVSPALAQRNTFWSRAEPSFTEAYQSQLGALGSHAVTFVILLGVVVLVAARTWNNPSGKRRLAPHDVAACLACLAIPAAALAVGHWAHVFAPRYLTFAAVGSAFALPQLVWCLAPWSGLADVVATLGVAVAVVAGTGRTIIHPPPPHVPFVGFPVLASAFTSPQPVVITGGIAYLQVWYDAPEADRSRALYLADPAGQLRDAGSDTTDRGYLALARWTPVGVIPIREFVRTHKHFRLYSFGPGWIERTLVSLEARFTEISREPSGIGRLYEVALPESSP